MIRADKDALICDFAETYGIYDMKRLPMRTAASFAAGLRDDSRIKLKMTGAKTSPDTALLMGIVDRLSMLLWMQTSDARHGRNKPVLMSDAISTDQVDKPETYSTADQFKRAWQERVKK